jgi:hypothetical protein
MSEQSAKFQMNLINHNPETGIAYGYISANALDSEVVDHLLYHSATKNHTYDEFVLEIAHGAGFDPLNTDAEEARMWIESDEAPEETLSQLEQYQGSEELIEGVYEGVYYSTSWLGGALNFWIFLSPHSTKQGRKASPCVPGACILDTLDGEAEGYDVPPQWRHENADC